MASTLYYSSVDVSANQYPCKGDIISVTSNNQLFKGIINSFQGDYVTITLERENTSRRVQKNTIKNYNRYIDKIGISNIPIEENDLVCLESNNEKTNGIITQVFVPQQQVQVAIISRKLKSQSITINAKDVRFCTKGYIPGNDSTWISEPSTTLSSRSSTHGQSSSTVDAVLVTAPCVVKVVPYGEDPNNYDDLIAVEYSGNENDGPSILPLVRMKCGSILVVRAPPV